MKTFTVTVKWGGAIPDTVIKARFPFDSETGEVEVRNVRYLTGEDLHKLQCAVGRDFVDVAREVFLQKVNATVEILVGDASV